MRVRSRSGSSPNRLILIILALVAALTVAPHALAQPSRTPIESNTSSDPLGWRAIAAALNDPSVPWTLCAKQNTRCSFTGQMMVRYGLPGYYAYRLSTDAVMCSDSVFGNPRPGYTKYCAYRTWNPGAVSTNPVPQPRAIAPVTTPTPTTPPVTAPVTTPTPTTPPVTATAVTTPPTLATVPPTTSPATTAPPPSSFTGVNPAPIASNFNATGMIGSGWPIPVSTASEPSGAFRFFCNVSHLSYDDPIVYPGQTGKAHLHMFFGNTATNAFSTYESLRTTGDGTCHGGPLNRSAYWAPVVLNGDGNVVMPDFILNYYKGMGGTAETIAGLPVLPAGLRMIAGYDMNNPSAVTSTFWYCESIGPNATNPQYSKTIIACPAGDRVIARVAFPMCWDGVHLDSPNHRSHMSYEVWDGYGHSACPSTHPVRLAEYSMGIFWPSDGKVGSWKLSSDTMPGMTHAPGSTFHADWFGAWDPGVMQTWMRECVNKMRSCNSGELGNGTYLSGAYTYPIKLHAGPAVVPVPPTV